MADGSPGRRAVVVVLAWLGRAVLAAAVAGLVLGGPPRPYDVDPLGLLRFAVALAVLGILLLTFRPLRWPGAWLTFLGLSAMFTGYGVIGLVDPGAIIADSARGTRGPDLDTTGGARIWASVVLAVGLVIAVFAVGITLEDHPRLAPRRERQRRARTEQRRREARLAREQDQRRLAELMRSGARPHPSLPVSRNEDGSRSRASKRRKRRRRRARGS